VTSFFGIKCAFFAFFFRKRQEGPAPNFSRLGEKHLFITTCIKNHCTRPLVARFISATFWSLTKSARIELSKSSDWLERNRPSKWPLLFRICKLGIITLCIEGSGVKRPLSYKTKTTFLMTIKLLTQDLKKTFPYRKNQASYAVFSQSYRYYACNQKNLLIIGFNSSHVLLHPKLGSFRSKTS